MSFVGKYRLSKSENFDDYMKKLDVSFMLRKLASTATPTQEISENNGNWTIKTVTTFKKTEINFKLNEEFDEETADNRQVKTLVADDVVCTRWYERIN